MALNKKLSEARLVYLENYSEFNKLIQHHKQFGFEVEDSACCGPGPVCNSLSFKICEDATKYVFWDSVHPTERTYNILVSDIVKKNIHKFV
ncbi:GDSL esterase/lipase [Glycine soja]|nr:GDSL esterase/lipase [Glycine soja]